MNFWKNETIGCDSLDVPPGANSSRTGSLRRRPEAFPFAALYVAVTPLGLYDAVTFDK